MPRRGASGAEVPGRLVLRSSRRTWVLVLAGCAAFVVVGAAVGRDEVAGLLAIAFFGVCGIVALAMVLFPSSLAIDGEGMTLRHLWRRQRFEFRDCGPFRAWQNPRAGAGQLVVFDWSGAQGPLADLSEELAGANGALPDTFGMSAGDLADLLNERRARSGG